MRIEPLVLVAPLIPLLLAPLGLHALRMPFWPTVAAAVPVIAGFLMEPGWLAVALCLPWAGHALWSARRVAIAFLAASAVALAASRYEGDGRLLMLALHLGYGGFAGSVFAAMLRRRALEWTIWTGAAGLSSGMWIANAVEALFGAALAVALVVACGIALFETRGQRLAQLLFAAAAAAAVVSFATAALLVFTPLPETRDLIVHGVSAAVFAICGLAAWSLTSRTVVS